MLPRFGSPSVFGAIFDDQIGGFFKIAATHSESQFRQMYLPETNVLITFWMVEALSRAGRLDEALFIFEKMMTYANHLGLYAEEVGPTGEALGNFPQALTHLGLIEAAVEMDQAVDSKPQ